MASGIKKTKIYYLIFGILYFAGLYYYLLTWVHPELHYHLQQPPFLANKYFFLSYLKYPGGLLEYFSVLLAQFLSINWLGALLLSLTGIGFTLLLLKLAGFFKLSPVLGFLVFIPAILLPGLFHNYLFPLDAALGILFSYLITTLFVFLRKFFSGPYLLFALLGILTYITAGSGSFLVFAVSVLIILFFTEPVRRSLSFFLIVGSASLVLPWLAYKFLFNISLSAAYFDFLPDQPRILTYKADTLFRLFVVSLPILMLLFSLNRFLSYRIAARKQQAVSEEESTEPDTQTEIPEVRKSKAAFRIWVINVFLILFLSYQVIHRTQKPLMKNTVLVDFYTYIGDWDRAIETALSERVYNVFINFNYNRAIEQKGEYLNRFFEYPQMFGPDILYPNKVAGSDIALVSSDYYYDLGYMGESLHWAHEAQTLYPYSPRLLKRMIMINLVNANYKTAAKYLNVLDDNFLSKKFVREHRAYISDTASIHSNKEIMTLRAHSPKGVIASNIETNFKNLLRRDLGNRSAFEHLQIYYLMNHRLEDFFRDINLGKAFYSGKSPSLFEEASMVYLLEKDRNQLTRFNANSRTKSVFSNYVRIMKKYNNDTKAAQKEMYRYIGGTYLYYLIYYYPSHARNASLKSANPKKNEV